MRVWYREPRLVLGATTLTAACVLVLWTTIRAFAADPHDEGAARSQLDVVMPAIEESAALPAALLEQTVDHDPFHPERRRPRTPFRLPAEEEAANPAAPSAAPASQLRLLGTVVTPGQDAFAMSQLGSDAPRVVRVGGMLGGFTLRKSEPGRAVFAAPNGETMDLRVPKAGP